MPSASLDSPETEPSTWQVRFGRKPQSQPRQNEQETNRRTRSSAQHTGYASTPSIADQLFSALKARETHLEPEQELSRECAEQLLGKRNAFVPDLRMFEQQHAERDKAAGGDIASAQDIIRARFQLENQAEAMRQQKKQSGTATANSNKQGIMARSGRAPEAKQRVAQRQSQQPHNASSSERLAGVRENQSKRSMFELDVANVVQREETKRNANIARKPVQERRERQFTPRSAPVDVSSRVRAASDSLKQPEERQQRLRERKAARAVQSQGDIHSITATVSNQLKSEKPRPPRSSNQDETGDTKVAVKPGHKPQHPAGAQREERLLQEKIERLADENQRAIAMEEQLRHKEHSRQIRRCVFSIWRKALDQRKLQEARVRQTFNWRRLQSVWVHWRKHVQDAKHERIAKETRAQLMREKQSDRHAEGFYRQKQLPKWFYRWSAFVTAVKEAREVEITQQRRKEQTQRLMERLIRKQAAPMPSADDQQADENGKSDSSNSSLDTIQVVVEVAREASRKDSHSFSSHIRRTKAPLRRAAWDKEDEPSGAASRSCSSQSRSLSELTSLAQQATRGSAPPVADPLYVSMQERAAERKQRRDLLKQKYEQLDQERREATEMQRAEREAQLLQQKMHEQQRTRERRREEALVAREKQRRLEFLEMRHRAARRHNDSRLVFYYGFLPLKRQWELSKRVSSNASAWHQLRVLHSNWHRWLQFVHDRYIERQQIERQKLETAARHHARTLKRKVFQRFESCLQQMHAKELAVQRQTQWNFLRHTWQRWQQTFAVTRMNQRQHEQRVMQKVRAATLRRMWIQWRVAVAEWKQEKQHQQEKEKLWTKVRGWLNE